MPAASSASHGHRRRPLTGLPIPADSEIAIEGEVLPNDLMPEGPFGEWTGYYASNQPAVPVIRVKAVYHRNDPILCGFPLLKPSSGDNLHFSLMLSALIWNAWTKPACPTCRRFGRIRRVAAS